MPFFDTNFVAARQISATGSSPSDTLPSSIDVQRSNDAFWASTAMTALLSGHLGLCTTR
jgi:hypothetical protein